jgi:hypothetical protein
MRSVVGRGIVGRPGDFPYDKYVSLLRVSYKYERQDVGGDVQKAEFIV